MAETKPLFKTALSGCGELARYMAEIKEKSDHMQALQSWAKVSKQIYTDNKSTIDNDISLELEQWKASRYFEAGIYAGQI